MSHMQAELSECKTIIWNGPMGVFEMEKVKEPYIHSKEPYIHSKEPYIHSSECKPIIWNGPMGVFEMDKVK